MTSSLFMIVCIVFSATKIPSSLCQADTFENVSTEAGVAEKLIINNKYETDEIFQENKNEGENIVLNCEFTPSAAHAKEQASFDWYHNGTVIAENKSSARSYVTDKTKGYKKVKMLVMKTLTGTYDNGLYECIVKYNEMELLKRRVNLIVIKPAYWTNKDKVTSATLGESLIINCDAKGTPKPHVDIELSNGSLLPGDFIVRRDTNGEDVENTIFVKNLTMDHRGVEIRCVASQVLDESDVNPVVVKTVTVDVFYKPTFVDGNEVKRYGILNSDLNIKCQVIDSNPPVTSFVFYELSKDPDSKEVKEEIKEGFRDYKVESFIEIQTATLKIPNLNETHFDEYTYECLARNQHNLEDTQKITLLQIQTPVAPQFTDVTESKADDDTSVVWKVENFEKSSADSPVFKYRIKYDLEENVNTTNWDEVNVVEFLKRDNNLYKIPGLQQNTRYAFRFQGVNAAGEGDWSPIPCDKCTAIPRSSQANDASQMKNCILWTWLLIFTAKYVGSVNC